jgi:hypothetical protein
MAASQGRKKGRKEKKKGRDKREGTKGQGWHLIERKGR